MPPLQAILIVVALQHKQAMLRAAATDHANLHIKRMPLELTHDTGTAGQGRLLLFTTGAVA